MTRDAEFVTRDPHWLNFLLGISPLSFFTGVEATGTLSRDVSQTPWEREKITTSYHSRERAR